MSYRYLGAVALAILMSLPALALDDEPVKIHSHMQTAPPAQFSAPKVCWQDDSVKPLAVILCLHGLGLHKGNYSGLGERLAKDGLIVYAIDMPGFGELQKQSGTARMDFPAALNEVKNTLEFIHKEQPNLPVVLLGESMGGAVALHATCLNPNLVSGLIASVPAGDRFGQSEEELKVGIHAILNGFHGDMNVGRGVVKQATQKEDLRKAWEEDPLARMQLSPKELIDFQVFMNKNFECAKKISDTPVLFIQGMHDKLVRPAGTWKLYESLTTPSKELVFSKSAEHLIFEESQFQPDDIAFVETWLSNKLLSRQAADTLRERTRQVDIVATPTPLADAKPTPKADQDQAAPQAKISLGYWIELLRNGTIYRCNNKSVFKSGDAIRFHFLPASDGYAYIVMKQSSTGKKAVLFPEVQTGLANMLSTGQEYALPTKAWLKFDEHPGVEIVRLIFSHKPIDVDAPASPVLAFISADRSGSKDLVPTRMQLSWDDPDPVILPTQFSNIHSAHLAVQSSLNKSLVRLTQEDSADAFSVDIALTHL